MLEIAAKIASVNGSSRLQIFLQNPATIFTGSSGPLIRIMTSSYYLVLLRLQCNCMNCVLQYVYACMFIKLTDSIVGLN